MIILFCVFLHQVIFLSDMVADPVGTLEDVFTFLGMNFIDVEGKNVSSVCGRTISLCKKYVKKECGSIFMEGANAPAVQKDGFFLLAL